MSILTKMAAGLLGGLIFVLFANNTQAQPSEKISGIVLNLSGEPLSGVNITLIDSSGQQKTSASTNASGAFQFMNLPGGAKYKITATHVGYEVFQLNSFLIREGVRNSLVIRLKPLVSDLNDVVVIGYGSIRKSDVTGAVSSLKSDKINQVAAGDATQVLQGRISGVTVLSQTWRPGNMAQVRIRGNRSINASNEPLYVVDGIPFSDAINVISPNDIESIEVLKDASATAIYGNRGANGVILITTKKGVKGKSQVEYNGYYGIQKDRPLPALMSAADFVEYSREAQRNALGGTYNKEPNKELDFKNEQLVATPYMLANMERAWASGTYDPTRLISTDWMGYGIRQGSQQNHQISVSGGNDRTRFLLSADYFRNAGVVRDQDFTRYSVRINAEHAVSDIIKVGTQTVFSNSSHNAGWDDVFSEYGLKSFNPLASPYDEDGKTLTLFPTNNTRTPNPITNFGNTKRVNNKDRFLGNYYLDITPLKYLNFRSNFGIDYSHLQHYEFNAANTASAGGQAPSSAINSGVRKFMYNFENILSYNRKFNKTHSLNATLVQSLQSEKTESNSISVKDLPYDEQLYYNVGSALIINGVASNLSKWSIASFMGRLNYGYKEKYLVTASARYDGSSRLAEGRKWVMFPSVALAWRINNEPFLRNSNVLSDLKLRLGWGRTGNSAINPYKTWGSLSTIRYVFGDASVLGFTPLEMINPSLTWETTSQYNLGLDFGFLKNRITGSLEWYRQNTYDLLLNRQLPMVSGFSQVLSNIGRTMNQGIELNLQTVNLKRKNLDWRSDWIFSMNRQEIVELYNGKQDDVGARWFIGKPVQVHYDLGADGVWQNTPEDQELMSKFNNNGSTFKPGDIRPKDINGDFKIDANDRYIIGQVDPKWTASLNNTIHYKNWDASIFVLAMVGHTLYHDVDMRFDGRYNQPKLDYWTPINPSKNYPRPLLGTAGLNYLSTLNYYDASFFRIRNISLGYTLPSQSLSTLKAKRLRIYGSVQNPLLITRFPGSDPEGATGFNEPASVTWLMGVNLQF